MNREEPKKRKVGRPRRGEDHEDLRQSLIDAAIALIQMEDVEQITIRSICERAGVSIGTYYHYFKSKDDLFSHFVKEMTFGEFELTCPPADLAGRVTELWMKLVELYRELGMDFLVSFYNSGNRAISAYADKEADHYPSGTLLARCQAELEQAQRDGYLRENADPHTVAADLCLILKGCVLDWVICRGEMPLEESVRRIFRNYMTPLTDRQVRLES